MAGERTGITVINRNPTPIELPNSNNLPFGFSLNDTNFKIWSRMIEVHVAQLNKLGYIKWSDSKDG